MKKIKIAFFTYLAYICAKLAEFFEERERRWYLCPDCGKSMYYHNPCVVRDEKAPFQNEEVEVLNSFNEEMRALYARMKKEDLAE